MPRAQVLIVDDETDVIEALKLRLETAGYRALTASDGAEALAVLRLINVDLILADLMMPNLDGLELTRRVRQDPRWLGVQVLLFSCQDDPVVRRLALEFGAQDYLSKAVGAPAIISRIGEILRSDAPGVPAASGHENGYWEAEQALVSQLCTLSRNSAEPVPPHGDFCLPPSETPEHGGRARETTDDLLKLALALQRQEADLERRRSDSAGLR